MISFLRTGLETNGNYVGRIHYTEWKSDTLESNRCTFLAKCSVAQEPSNILYTWFHSLPCIAGLGTL